MSVRHMCDIHLWWCNGDSLLITISPIHLSTGRPINYGAIHISRNNLDEGPLGVKKCHFFTTTVLRYCVYKIFTKGEGVTNARNLLTYVIYGWSKFPWLKFKETFLSIQHYQYYIGKSTNICFAAENMVVFFQPAWKKHRNKRSAFLVLPGL